VLKKLCRQKFPIVHTKGAVVELYRFFSLA
jgi:hypothetical protein